MTDSLASEAFRAAGLFNANAVRKIWDDRPTYLSNIDWLFWNMIVLTRWQEEFGISAPRSPSS